MISWILPAARRVAGVCFLIVVVHRTRTPSAARSFAGVGTGSLETVDIAVEVGMFSICFGTNFKATSRIPSRSLKLP
jgi:hypothetical protein